MVLVIPDCFLVSIKGTSGGQDVVNVIGVHGPQDTAISVATSVLGAWKTTGGPLSKLPSQYQMVEVKAMSLNTAEGDIYSVGDATVGGLTGALSTNASCALITYGSGSRSKSQKGRMYLGPIREVDMNSDGRTLASPTVWTTAIQAFRTALNSNGREWSVLSRKLSTHVPITSVVTQSVIGTQRRRIR